MTEATLLKLDYMIFQHCLCPLLSFFADAFHHTIQVLVSLCRALEAFADRNQPIRDHAMVQEAEGP